MNKKIYLILAIGIITGGIIGYFIAKTSSNNLPIQESANLHIESSAHPEIWTCSMDPQVRQPEPGDCPICGMDLIPLESGSNSDDPLVLEMTEDAVRLVNIQTTVLGESGGAQKTIRLNGKIKADERRSVSQTAHIPGRIEQLFITFTGEKVGKGQKLATIYSPELIAAQKELLEALKLSDLNPKLVDAARNKLKSWKISTADIDAIENTGEIKELFTVFAESSGVVVNRRISVGDYVNTGQVLFDLIDLRKLWVVFDGYEEDLANLKPGSRIKFSTPSLPGKEFQTKISYIDPMIDPQTRVAAVRADVNNSSGLLKPEMFVKGELKARTDSNQKLMVPKSAILWTGKRSIVYVKVPEVDIPSFSYRQITLGPSLGESYLVENGLSAGEEVVTNGNFAIDASAQLNNQVSMMNKHVKIKGQDDTEQEEVTQETAEKGFYEYLDLVVTNYLSLKDALVETDSVNSIPASKTLSNQLIKIDLDWFAANRQTHWEAQIKNMRSHADQLTVRTGIEEQRMQFEHISNILVNIIKSFGIESDTLYLQHCPMVDRNRGADWISSEEGIRNPYFGYKMMKCGRVKETFVALE